jgi:hypothetical protein
MKDDAIVVKLNYGFMETFGGNSLIGKIFKENPEWKLNNAEKTIILQLPVPTIEWLEKNKAPHLSLVSSSFPICFLEDIICLQGHGHRILIKEVIEDPKEN